MIHHSQGPKAEYLIAQYMEDLFRREVRNLGVFVRKEGQYAARFFGETEPGTVDGRRVKSLAAPDVYKQWVQYWRGVLATEQDPFAELRRYPSANYPVIAGGEILDSGADSADAVADFLYSALVAEGGFAQAFGAAESDAGSGGSSGPRLNKELEAAFRSLNILAAQNEGLALIRHPVVARPEVKGTTAEPHRPQFAQQNGRLYVMETVDFTERAQNRARDHAGFASFMFRDLRDAMRDEVVPIAIVRTDVEVQGDEFVRYGMSMLTKTAAEVVDWADPAARTRFIADRRQIALAAA